jgi:predicted mannosyl-3-phosphoglycerate phosphatase (HAD superfamily)
MTIKISDDVVFRDLAGEAVILNLATGTYFGLDEVGTRIWHVLAEHGSKDKVIEVLLGEYEVEEEQLRHDVDHLIQQLSDKGLVTSDAQEIPQPS